MFDFTDIVTDIIREHVNLLPGQKIKHGNKINVRCFHCGDSKKSKRKKRGWVYFNRGEEPSYYCWNCGHSASGIGLASEITGLPIKELYSNIFRELKDDSKNIVSKDLLLDPQLEPQLENNIRKTDFQIPNDWTDINADCKELLKCRKILEAPYIPNNWKFYYSKQFKRLVIPWLDPFGNMYTYQTRALYKNQNPKYLFEKDSDKLIFVADSNISDDFPYIFLGEGIFDVIWVKHGICIGGISPTTKQKEEIQKLFPFHQSVLLFDNPWIDQASKTAIIKLAETSPNQLIFMWKKENKSKDINDDILISGDLYKYTHESFLKSSILTASNAKIQLLFNFQS